MTDALIALTSMTASGEDCGCDANSTGPLAALPESAYAADVPQAPASATSVFWEGPLGMEGEMTGDGRYIEHGALSWQMPAPLRYVRSDVGEHGGAVVVGRILATERQPNGVLYGYGDFDMGHPDGIEAERQVREELTTGVSMDLDDVDFEVRVAAELVEAHGTDAPTLPTQVNEDGTITLVSMKADDEIRATLKGRMRAATIVAIPAFANARLKISQGLPPGITTTDVPAALDLDSQGLPAYEDEGQDVEAECSTDPEDPNYDPECVEVQQVNSPAKPGLVAGAYPLAPPSEWFSNPHFKMAVPLTVTEEGRVFGHLAAWNTCHIGMSHSGCVTAPKSRSGYAYFHTGSIVTAENAEIPVGHITLNTTHAPTSGLSAAGAQNHYEVTGNVVADVVAGEDAHGIWVSGALRPNTSAAKVRELRAAPLSGDWRRVSGNLELVAALAVNVPGFPIPRPKGLVAGGVVQSLVASGMIPPKTVLRPGTEGALSLDDLRYLKRLAARERAEEQALQASGTTDAAAELAQRVRASALAMRVHSTIKETS